MKKKATTFKEILKFNPYHDSKGRFATADGATSFTYKPGQGKMYDNAIAREKERHAAGLAGGAAGSTATSKPKERPKLAPKEKTPRVKAIHKVEDKIRNQEFESAAVVDSEGNQLYFKNGQRSQVGFSRLECMQMRNNTLTHNHPRCSMFSPEDLNCMAYNGLYEIRATNRDGTTYSMKQAAGGYTTDNAIKFVGAYAAEYPKSTVHAQRELDNRGFQDKIWKGEITADEANIEFGRVTAKYMADFAQREAPKYGLEFTVEHAQATTKKSEGATIMKASPKKEHTVLDKETNDMMDAAFSEWLKKHGLSEKKEVAKSFDEVLAAKNGEK